MNLTFLLTTERNSSLNCQLFSKPTYSALLSDAEQA